MLRCISIIGYICLFLAIMGSVLSTAAALAGNLLALGLVLILGAMFASHWDKPP